MVKLCAYGMFCCFAFGLFQATFASDQDAQRDYDRAVELGKEGLEEKAKLSWSDFIRRYPNHKHTDNAHYFLGEVYQRQSNWEQAAHEYRKVFHFPKSEMIPMAAYNLGYCLLKTNNEREARIQWSAVIRKFPKSEGARLSQLKLQELEVSSDEK